MRACAGERRRRLAPVRARLRRQPVRRLPRRPGRRPPPARGAAGSPPRRRCRATAALLLSACGDSRPGTAAVVGDQRITDGDLQSLVNESLSAPGVRAALPNSDYKGDIGAYRRAVLNVEVERLLAENGAQQARHRRSTRTRSTPGTSPSRTSPAGPDAFASRARLPARGVPVALPAARPHRGHRVRDRLHRGQGQAADRRRSCRRSTSSTSRRRRTATLSLIQVPSQAIADQAAAALKADPSQFAAVAAQLRRVRLADRRREPQKYPAEPAARRTWSPRCRRPRRTRSSRTRWPTAAPRRTS